MSLLGNSVVIEDLPKGLDPTLASMIFMKKCISSGLASNQPLLEFPGDEVLTEGSPVAQVAIPSVEKCIPSCLTSGESPWEIRCD